MPNAQLIADQFAMNGYFAIMPDLFYGDAVPLNKPGEFDMQKWRNGGYHPEGKNHLPSTVDPIVESCLREMRTEFNCKVRMSQVKYNDSSINRVLENWCCGILLWRQVCRAASAPGENRCGLYSTPIPY